MLSENYENVQNLEQSLLDVVRQEDLIPIDDAKLWPDTLQVLQKLKQAGYKLAAISNSTNPARITKIMNSLELAPLFDKVSILNEPQDSTYIVQILQNIANDLGCAKAVLVGDSLSKDMKIANQAGIPGIWANFTSKNTQQQIEIINQQAVIPTASIYALAQLPSVLETLEVQGASKVGLLLCTQHKRRSLINKGCFSSTPELRFCCIEPYAELEAQGPFDVILHKISEIVSSEDPQDKAAVKRLRDYIEAHPETKVIDSLDVFNFTLNRQTFMDRIEEVLSTESVFNGIKVRIPWFATYEPGNYSPSDPPSFPLVVKSLNAVNTEDSHTHTLAFNSSGMQQVLSQYTNGYILQEFINHDGIVYKVYFAGKKYWAHPSKSIANLADLGVDQFQFDSQKPFPQELLSGSEPIVRELDAVVMSKIGEITREITKSTLFGIDVLVEANTGDYVVIDFNYFSSFGPTPNLGEELNEHILSIIK